MQKLIRKIMDFDLDKWLTREADQCGIEGGQGRAGGAVLFSAILATGGALMLTFIGMVIVAGKTFGLLH
ncbi:MAG: hypothetical protein BWY31_04364 [Lentisphaerae bacterium ADurb.Bin242]|nr:MAG: hypothetical protein BWY31_04364 [Lentisphaerae bacterium ADurb.Bin242]